MAVLSSGIRRVPRVAWLLLALALVVRLGFIAATPDYRPGHDDRDYDRLACSLVEGGGYAAFGPEPTPSSCGSPPADTRPTAFRPPGFPFVLAAIYMASDPLPVDRWLAARALQALVGTLAVGLLGIVAAQIWGRRTALVTMGLGGVYLPLVVLGGSLITEPLMVTLMLGAIAATLAHRESRHPMRWIALAGLLAGLATLTRSNGAILLLPLAFATWTLRPRRSVRSLARPLLLVAVAAATVLPWTVRNAVALDDFVPVTTEVGSAFAGTYNDRAREDPVRPGAWRPPARLRELAPIVRDPDLTESSEARRLVRHGLEYMADHPGYVLEVGARNTGRLTGLEGGADWWRFTARTISSTDAAGDAAAVCFFLFAALAVVGAFLPATRRAPPWLWAIPLVFWLSVILLVGETRFRAPIDPFVVLLAAVALTSAWERRRAE